MKNLKVAAFSVCITFCSVCAIAQNIQNRSVSVNEPDYNKPKLLVTFLSGSILIQLFSLLYSIHKLVSQ